MINAVIVRMLDWYDRLLIDGLIEKRPTYLFLVAFLFFPYIFFVLYERAFINKKDEFGRRKW